MEEISMKNHISITVGNNISRYRKMSKMTQIQLAEKMEKSQGHISQYESGDRELSYEDIIKICQILQIEPNELFNLY